MVAGDAFAEIVEGLKEAIKTLVALYSFHYRQDFRITSLPIILNKYSVVVPHNARNHCASLKRWLIEKERHRPRALILQPVVERLNLTIRQGSASPCHARGDDQLRGHVELLRCHYNFVRPHGALTFGRETRTPAMQAGVASTRLNWSDIFTAAGLGRCLLIVVVRILVTVQFIDTATAARPTVSGPHQQRLAA